MSKKSILPQKRRHIMMYDEDWEFLMQYYEHDPQGRPSPGIAIRNMVHRRVMAMKEEINAKLSGVSKASKASSEEAGQ